MSVEVYDYLFKLLLVGDSAVGKTSLLLRFTQGEFKDSIRNTVGVDLKVKMVNFHDRKLKLTIWDTGNLTPPLAHTHASTAAPPPLPHNPLSLVCLPLSPVLPLSSCQPVRSVSER